MRRNDHLLESFPTIDNVEEDEGNCVATEDEIDGFDTQGGGDGDTVNGSSESILNRAASERTWSLFSIEDCISRREEMKGAFVVTHTDSPKVTTRKLTDATYSHQKQNVESRDVESRGGPRVRGFSLLSCVTESPLRPSRLFQSLRKPITDNVHTECPNIKHELEPAVPLNCVKVKKIILDEFEKLQYLPHADHKSICLKLSAEIKTKVKLLGLSRYKYIVIVTMGEDEKQGLSIVSRFCWDEKHDNYVSQTLKTKNTFIVANVYAIYTL